MFDKYPHNPASALKRVSEGRDPCQRDSRGCFVGEGVVPMQEVLPAPDFVPLEAAASLLSKAISTGILALTACELEEEDASPPVAVIRASPGAGKSREVREVLSSGMIAEIGEVAFLSPTLALSEEAAEHARMLGANAIAIRGRDATTPDGSETMCRKSALTSRAARLGLPIREHFCDRRGPDGEPLRCAHFDDCAYLAQLAPTENGRAQQRYLATSYLTLPDPTGREVGLRIIDETFFQQLEHTVDVALAAFTRPRLHYPQLIRAQAKTKRTEEHADLLKAAADVAGALVAGKSPLQLIYSAEDYERLARMEMAALPGVDGLTPDRDMAAQVKVLERAEMESRLAYRFRRLWLILAEAKRQGRDETERLSLVITQNAHHIRIFARKDLPSDAPLLLLDADADPQILAAIGCAPQAMTTLSLRPNAQVMQLHDRRMSKGTLLASLRLRWDWRSIIEREVLYDQLGPQGGVLVGATRAVVKAFFVDAGHDFEDLSETRISQIMLGTPLHGASWTWFGGRSLGSNRYRDHASVIIIGREELPVEVLENKARALFGDRPGEKLSFLEPNSAGQLLLPEETVPYLMTDGSACGVRVRCHPDRLIRALQRQGRECATRQLVERLRLARATYRKRVILGCSIPIPDLPVDRLLTWDELRPDRLAAAAVEAVQAKGGLRLSARGLTEDAPVTFTSENAAGTYRSRSTELVRDAHAAPEALGLGPLWPVWLRQRRCHAQEEPALVAARSGADAVARAEDIWGPLAACRSAR